jgi:hypothetical protein
VHRREQVESPAGGGGGQLRASGRGYSAQQDSHTGHGGSEDSGGEGRFREVGPRSP